MISFAGIRAAARRRAAAGFFGVSAALASGLIAAPGVAQSPTSQPEDITPQPVSAQTKMAEHPISPVPAKLPTDPRKVDLGRRLFSDVRLSGDNGLSCASCHMAAWAGSDGQPRPIGAANVPTNTNSLTVLNAALNASLGWRGNSRSLEHQILNVVAAPDTMGGDWDRVLTDLGKDRGMVDAFSETYPDGLTRDNVANAIAEYERTLITPDAPFDKYLRGDADAITPQAAAGYEIFKSYGCIACHQGVNVGGNMLQAFGIFGSPAAAADGAATPGAAQGTGISDSQPVFRVPSLRNVAHTAPYFHDGSTQTLPEAINIMAEYQLGRDISDSETRDIEAFLNSLTGELRGVPVGEYQ